MKNIVYIVVLCMTCFASLQAQPLNKSTSASLVDAADLAFEQKDWYNALEKYKEAYEEDKPTELAYKIALCMFELRDYVKAERYFTRVVRKDKKKQEYTNKMHYAFGRCLKMNGKYDEALEQLQLALSNAEDEPTREALKNEINGAELAKELVETLGLEIKHAGKNVNTRHSEYSPSFYGDGKTMYYSALESKEVIILDGNEDDYYLKIYRSTKKDKSWGKPEALDLKVNREDFHTGNASFSNDGERMYFTRALLEGNYLSESKAYMSKMGDEDWMGPTPLVGINGDYLVQHPVVGELFGREVLYFTSNMDGGYGGNDIYYATYKGEGVYADAVNLGPKINTPGDDETPFYRDGTLYFSSTGHPGIGGFDIFYSAWDGTGWSKATNMGQGYNSSVDDLFFKLDKEGYKGFFVSNRGGDGARSVLGKTCCNDIFVVSIAKVELSLVSSIFVGKAPLSGVNVQLVEMTNDRMGETKNKDSGQTNKAAFELELDKAYRVIASKEGYFPDTLDFNTVGLLESKAFNKSLKLKAVPKPPEPLYETYTTDQPIELQNIFYAFDDDKILPASEPDLQIILDLMEKYPDMKIELYSHTDSRGKDRYNLDLSQRRASSAKRWLVKRGVKAPRVRAVGKGEKEVRNRCKNGVKCEDEEHQYNRRTEFKITEGPTTIQIEKKRLRKKE